MLVAVICMHPTLRLHANSFVYSLLKRFIQVHDAGVYIFSKLVHGRRLDYNPTWFMVTGHVQPFPLLSLIATSD